LGAVVSSLLWSGACGDKSQPTGGQREGKELAAEMLGELAQSARWRAPYRCARARVQPTELLLHAPWKASRDEGGWTVELDQASKALSIGVLADARGADAAALEATRSLDEALRAEGAQVLVSLGGMASGRAELSKLFDLLAQDKEHLLIALPGDSESLPAHRALLDELSRGGMNVIDGSKIHELRIVGVPVRLVPGIDRAAQLVAGADGCLHTADDLSLVEADAGAKGPPGLIFSYAPPRQRDPDGSDLGLGGVHVGERSLAEALGSADYALLVHGMTPAGSGAPRRGTHRLRDAPLAIAAGAIDPLARHSEGLLVQVDASGRIRWHRVPATP
jgi:hypothetical protein